MLSVFKDTVCSQVQTSAVSKCTDRRQVAVHAGHFTP